jgi:hypothetical protein
MDDYIFYGYGRMNHPQMVNSSCRNNQEQEECYNAGIAEIALNKKEICAYMHRRDVEKDAESLYGSGNSL